MLKRELKFYWIALSADFAYMLFVFTVTRLMAEHQASLMALGILGAGLLAWLRPGGSDRRLGF